MKKMELRMSPIEIVTEDGDLRVSGIVNKPGQWSHMLGQRKKFIETICPGVFEKALRDAERVDFLADHNPNLLLASTTNGSLDVAEVDGEVRMSATICPTSYARDYFELMKNGLCNQMSFGFYPTRDRWQKQADGTYKRWIEEMKIVEVTATRFGAYGQSQISARGIDVVNDPEIPEDIELFMNEVRDMDNETFEKFKAQLKAEILEEIKHEQEVVVDEPKTEEVVSTTEEVEVATEPVVEVVEEQPIEQVQVDEPVVEEVAEPVIEEVVEEVKPFDVSAYLEDIKKLNEQKEVIE